MLSMDKYATFVLKDTKWLTYQNLIFYGYRKWKQNRENNWYVAIQAGQY